MVMAVLGILAAILLPTVRSARTAANRSKTRAQFSQWASGFEAFRQEYGSYPQFATNGAQKLVNPPGTPTQLAGNHLFHDLLAGVRRDGMALPTQTGNANPPTAVMQNPRRIRFVSFTEADFVTQLDVTQGRALPNQLNYIRDAFYNTQIGVVTDTNLDGVINGRDTTGGYPAVAAAGTTAPQIRPTTVGGLTTQTQGGIRAGVIFYCAPPGATTENDMLISWR